MCCSCLEFFTDPPHKNSFSDKEQRKKKNPETDEVQYMP